MSYHILVASLTLMSTGLTDIGSGTSSNVALGCLLWNILAVYQNLVSLPLEVLIALAQP